MILPVDLPHIAIIVLREAPSIYTFKKEYLGYSLLPKNFSVSLEIIMIFPLPFVDALCPNYMYMLNIYPEFPG